MRIRWRTLAGLPILLVFGSALALAQPPGKGNQKKTAGEKVREVLPEGEVVFTARERVVVRKWFGSHREGLPPGLAKRDRLPPRLEKQLRERGTLPPGLQKRVQPLPVELERELRKLPTGYRRVVIAGNVILMNEKTAVIYDIIRNAIP